MAGLETSGLGGNGGGLDRAEQWSRAGNSERNGRRPRQKLTATHSV